MPLVSVTRARMRGLWTVLPFAVSAVRAFGQAQRSPGFLGGSVLRDRRLAFWTMTVWESVDAMRGYMLTGAHRAAMPSFSAWCDEASVVHWEQDEAATPSWAVAAERMRRSGRPSKLRAPSPHHQSMTYAEPRLTQSSPIPAAR